MGAAHVFLQYSLSVDVVIAYWYIFAWFFCAYHTYQYAVLEILLEECVGDEEMVEIAVVDVWRTAKIGIELQTL